MAVRPLPPRKRTLAETLDRFEIENDQITFKYLDEMDEASKNAIGFRHNALRTQSRQDKHLENYRNFVKFFWLKSSIAELDDPEVLEYACFPEDFEKLYDRLRKFIYFVINQSMPLSSHNRTIAYPTFCQYRNSMQWWTARTYKLRGTEPPPTAVTFNRMTEMARYTMRKRSAQFGFSTYTRPKSHLGVAEVKQLIDMDLRGTACIELAECHQLAWCIGRSCAVRPGALGCPKDKFRDPVNHLDFFAWKDVKIYRSKQSGEFALTLTVRNIKLNQYVDASVKLKTITYHIKPPRRQENVPLSIVHRLLTIAIRRGALVGISSIDDLLNQQGQEICIKEEFMDKPILLMGTPRGLGVSNEPMRASALTDYISRRGRKLGYSEAVTFYSIRHRAANDLSRAYGDDIARLLMGHGPDSRSLEKYYLDKSSTVNVGAVGVGELELMEDGAVEMMAERNCLATTRLTAEQLAKTQGRTLNALCRAIAASDPNYPWTDARTRKLYDKRIRYAALKSLLEEQHAVRRATETIEEVDQARKRVAMASEAAGLLVKEAARRLGEALTATKDAAQDPINDVLYHQEFPELAEVDEFPELDMDQDPTQLEDGTTDVDIDQDEEAMVVEDPESADIPYEWVVRTFMDIMIGNGFSKLSHTGVATRINCPLCLDDETLPETMKERLWEPNFGLNRHLRGSVHSGSSLFQRRAEIAMQEHLRSKYVCTFCERAAPKDGTVPQYNNMRDLIRHIDQSNATRLTIQKAGGTGWMKTLSYITTHDALKAEEGWYKPDWKGLLEKKVKNKAALVQQSVARSGIRYANIKELESPIPHNTLPGIVYGSFHSNDIPDHLQSRLTYKPQPCIPPQNAYLRGLTASEVNIEKPSHLDAYFVQKKSGT